MREPLQDLPPKKALTPESMALETAFDQGGDLPFFDLDIALIRRGQESRQQTKETQPASSMPVTEFARERQALDALEALLAARALSKPYARNNAPVALFPKPVPAAAAKQDAKYIQPRLQPTTPQTDVFVGFVSPAFKRVDVPATDVTIEAGEPLSALASALLQTARDVTARVPDLLPELKVQFVRQAIARRESLLDKALRAETAKSQALPKMSVPTMSPTTAGQQVEASATDDMPWGHVTFRLAIM